MSTHKIKADLDVDGEVQGTSLDINGNSDISGNLTMSGNGNVVMGTGQLKFADGGDIFLGDSNDLKLYHDGSNSYIEDSGTGNLKIRTSALNVVNAANSENMISATENGAVTLYYDNALKLTTASGGINVTGTITSTGQITGTELEGTSLDINGNADISGTLNVTGQITNAGNVLVEQGAPKLILKDSTDNDDHSIIFRRNTDDDDYKIATADFTSGGGGDGFYIGSIVGAEVGLVTNNTTALTLDTSQNATFAGDITVGDDVFIADSGVLNFGSDNDFFLFHDGTDAVIRNSTGHLYFDNLAQDKDIYIRGNDGGSTITALTFDMSAAGNATFAADITCGDDLFMPSGGVINFNSGDVTFTHSSNNIQVDGGNFLVQQNIECQDFEANGVITGDGSGITELDGGSIASGTIASARLDADTAHLTTTQTFSGSKTFSAAVTVSNSTASTSKTTGAIKVTGGVGIAKNLNVGEDVVAFASSDERYKDNLQAITNPIDKVKSLTGYTFTWNDKHEQFNGSDDIGVVAQEVEKVFPEIVDTRDNGYKAVKYEKMVAVLIEAVKDQQKQIDELKAIINGNA